MNDMLIALEQGASVDDMPLLYDEYVEAEIDQAIESQYHKHE